MSVFTIQTSAGTSLFDVSDAGAVSAAGALSAVGLGTGTGALTLTASNGATLQLKSISGTATLATGGATTTITLASGTLPAGSAVVAGSVRISTSIAGINSTEARLKLNGSADTLVELAAFTSGTTGFTAGIISVSTADEATFVLSGGADNTPSAGAVKYAIFALVPTAPTA